MLIFSFQACVIKTECQQYTILDVTYSATIAQVTSKCLFSASQEMQKSVICMPCKWSEYSLLPNPHVPDPDCSCI